MAGNTPNHGFYIPDDFEDGWGDDKGNDWQDLDQILQNIPAGGDLSQPLQPAGATPLFDQSLNQGADVSFGNVDASSYNTTPLQPGGTSPLFDQSLNQGADVSFGNVDASSYNTTPLQPGGTSPLFDQSVNQADSPTFAQVTASNAPAAPTDVVRQQELSGDISPSSVSTGSLSNTPAENSPQSLYSGISQGYAVALSPNSRMKSVDPTTFATDDAALQALNDWLVAQPSSNGTLYIPSLCPDGTQWTIESTVTIGSVDSQSRVSVEFIGYNNGSNTVNTTITDGSPLFHVTGDTTNGVSVRYLTFRGGAFNFNKQNASIVQFDRIIGFRVEIPWATNYYGDAIRIGPKCFDWSIGNSFFNPNDDQATKTARCMVIEGDCGDGVIEDDVKVRGDCRNAIHFDGSEPGNIPPVRIGGGYENSNGLAQIVIEAPAYVFISPGTVLQNANSGAHGVYISDAIVTSVCASQIGGSEGDGIYVGSNVGELYIWDYTNFGNNTGNAINITSEPTTRAIIPREGVVDGGITYPSTPWTATTYSDGWRKSADRTNVTLATASTQTMSNVVPGETNAKRAAMITPSSGGQAASNYSVDHEFIFNNSTGNWDLELSWGTDPGVGMDFDIEVERQV